MYVYMGVVLLVVLYILWDKVDDYVVLWVYVVDVGVWLGTINSNMF